MRKKLLPSVILVCAAFTLGFLSPAKAVVPPSIEGGDFYHVKNLTKGGGFANSVSADKCEELQYRIQIHNPGPDEGLKNVVVKATIPATASTQNVSTATVSASNAVPQSVSDTTTVNLASSLKVSYIPGSSQLLNAQGGVISSIGDVTAGSGVNIGDVGVSINQQRFVVFKAKVECPDTPPPPVKKFECKALNVTQASRTRYNITAVAAVQNVTVQSYRFTVKNQTGATVDDKTVVTGALSADYQFDQSSPGEYIVTAVVNTDAGSTNPNDCAKKITVTEDGKPPVPPTTVTTTGSAPEGGRGGIAAAPGVLPQTGPADVAAVVAIATVISSALYYLVSYRVSKL